VNRCLLLPSFFGGKGWQDATPPWVIWCVLADMELGVLGDGYKYYFLLRVAFNCFAFVSNEFAFLDFAMVGICSMC
jgi:hypothetical protein